MRFVFGRGWTHFCDDTNGEGDGNGATGGAAGGDDGAGGGAGDDADKDAGADGAGAAAGAADDEAGAAAGAAGDKKGQEPKDMKAAIDAALGYTKDDGKGGTTKGAQPAEKKPAASAGAGEKETETHHANGKPKKDDKGQDLDAEGKVVQKAAPKLKTAAELDMKPEEKKLLGTKAQIRFGEVINTLKAHEGTITKQTETIKNLAAGRDAILGVMEETNTSQDQLAGYLHFNAMLQSSNPKDLESALEMVEQQRVALYAKLGREPEGGDVDLLKDFPDLSKQVADEEITRKAALEIAQARRDKAAREAAAQRQQHQERQSTETATQRKQASENALKGIEEWTAGLSKTDIDYKAKEDKLLAKLDGVLKNYSPDKWLPTLKLLYEGIEIQKAVQTSGRQHQPLRPSNARPGAKAPADMLEAINQGLGYAGAEKG